MQNFVALNYPEVLAYLDDSDEYENKSVEFLYKGIPHLLVTQTSDFDGGQVLFKLSPNNVWVPIAIDNYVDIAPPLKSTTNPLQCSSSTLEDHQKVYNFAVNQVDVFKTSKGPDGGNLACVWAVRNLIFNCLGRWVTKVDGTSVFNSELISCFGNSVSSEECPAGGIIISPTKESVFGRKIGHVGIVGPHTGDNSRLIYSNSSRLAIWKQNFTLESWLQRYKYSNKNLDVFFYPIPNK